MILEKFKAEFFLTLKNYAKDIGIAALKALRQQHKIEGEANRNNIMTFIALPEYTESYEKTFL